MQIALKLAQEAYDKEEVPVGAVIVFEEEIISRGKNGRQAAQNSLYHAEIEAINFACKALNTWHLTDCELYTTLEPCPMCTGAIINSRISKLIYGASDPKSGSCGSVINLFDFPYNHKPTVISGVLKTECSFILSDFFAKLRLSKKVSDSDKGQKSINLVSHK